VIVRKRQRRLDGIDQIVLSLTTRGLTTGEVVAPLRLGLRREGSKDTISRITDTVLEELSEWQDRPLDARHIRGAATRARRARGGARYGPGGGGRSTGVATYGETARDAARGYATIPTLTTARRRSQGECARFVSVTHTFGAISAVRGHSRLQHSSMLSGLRWLGSRER
jgi:hypothetical protein